MVELGQGDVAPHEHAPADVGADADQVNLELVDRRQSVITEGGWWSNG